MKIKLSHQITLIELPEVLTRKICATFTIENPAWIENNKRTLEWQYRVVLILS